MMTLCLTASAGQIISDFMCESDNGTMTFYSYFKEPQLEESSYTRGYKAGSINYLVNGKIYFKDEFEYYDGQEDGKHPNKPGVSHNSTFMHKQDVNFTGEKGISEFYAKGFYPNNRAVSAWKKIRYDDLSYVKSSGVLHLSGTSRIEGRGRSPSFAGSYNLGEDRKSSHILVEADVGMGLHNPGYQDYEFKYKANVTDGIIEIWDATGWTNRTGSGRIDWEQTALIKGDNINITNNLTAPDMSYPGADEDRDWLSCCIGGGEVLKKELKNETLDWPNEGTYMTLQPSQVKPSLSRETECIIDPITGILRCTDPPTYQDFECNYSSCPGYECIYQFLPAKEDENGAEQEDDVPPLEPEPGTNDTIIVEKFSETSQGNNDKVKYNIYVTNTGEGTLKSVTVTDILPEGLNYENDSTVYRISYGEEEEEEEDINITPNYSNSTRNLNWTIPEVPASRLNLNPTIKINVAFSQNSEDIGLNKVYASWKLANETVQKTEIRDEE